MMARKYEKGYTFLEILLVFVLISILTLMLVPSVHNMKEKGRQATCIGNQRQLAVASILYANESMNTLPLTIASLNSSDYMIPATNNDSDYMSIFQDTAYAGGPMSLFFNKDYRITMCPEVNGSILDSNPVYSYGFNVYITGVKLEFIESAATTVLLTDSSYGVVSNDQEVSFRHGDNIAIAAFVDGHVELFNGIIPPSRFTPSEDSENDDEQSVTEPDPEPEPEPEPEPPANDPEIVTYPPILDENGFLLEVTTNNDGQDTTITINLTSGENNKALSHVSYTFGLPLPLEILQQAAVTASSTNGYPIEIVDPDPQTGYFGLKFDETALGEDGIIENCIFTFTVPTESLNNVGDFIISTKAGTKIANSSITLE